MELDLRVGKWRGRGPGGTTGEVDCRRASLVIQGKDVLFSIDIYRSDEITETKTELSFSLFFSIKRVFKLE